jgi:Cys-rich protein (TIGR01571 family)
VPESIPKELSEFPKEITVKLVSPPQFQTGLCDCCLDISLCLHGTCCPCHLFGKNVEHLTGKGCCSNCCCYCIGCGPCNHAPYRRQLRLKYNLKEEPCNDCCVAFFCSCCALCQENREIMYQVTKPPQKSHPTRQQMV